MSESKEDNPTTASSNNHAQSECHCALYSNSVTYLLQELRLIVLLFQENKSFGVSTICIHPLMYGKSCREQLKCLTTKLSSGLKFFDLKNLFLGVFFTKVY
jgi:hypothetical protein